MLSQWIGPLEEALKIEFHGLGFRMAESDQSAEVIWMIFVFSGAGVRGRGRAAVGNRFSTQGMG